MRTHFIPAICALALVTGCATERRLVPKIESPARADVHLKMPLMATVFDGRTGRQDLRAAAALQAELTKIYGTNLQWVPYFEAVPSGRVAVRFRIMTLGATFGSRLIASTSYTTAIQSAQASAVGPWGRVVGSATGTSSVFESSFSGEGWWNGAAWVDVEIYDSRNTPSIRSTIPLAAERKESNMWGYFSGNSAARQAWESVASQLTRAIDDVLRTVHDADS